MKKWFLNLKISKKLSIGFLIVSLLGIFIGVVGIINLLNISESEQNTYDQCTLGIVHSSEAEINLLQVRTLVRDLYLYYDTEKDEYYTKIIDQLSIVEEELEHYSMTITDAQDQANYDKLMDAYETYKNDTLIILNAAESGVSRDDLFEVIHSVKGSAQDAVDQFEATTNYNVTVSSEEVILNKRSSLMAIYIMIGVIVISFISAMFISKSISASICNPMQKFAAFAEILSVGDIDVDKVTDEKDRLLHLRKDEVGILAGSFDKVIASTIEQAQKVRLVADGDLTTEITIRSEFDVLGKALHELVEKFHSLASSIVSSAEMVDSGAKLVADTSTSISRGASEQASSVEQLTASLEETTSQTTQNAKNAQTTDELTKNIKKDAEAGNTQMAEMLRAMDDINTSSDNIKKIIKVIEDIAFQTNILALNAAVEAARAGQHGKGFAVVAEEVRNLAAQSASAAKETTDLIENSIKKVEAGTKIANETAGALSKISTGTAKAAELVDAIASASSEQAMALNQINQGVMQVSDVVQSNAAAAEECAAASEELSTQANSLKASVAIFKLNMSNIDLNHNIVFAANSKPQKAEDKSVSSSVLKPQISLTEKNYGKY